MSEQYDRLEDEVAENTGSAESGWDSMNGKTVVLDAAIAMKPIALGKRNKHMDTQAAVGGQGVSEARADTLNSADDYPPGQRVGGGHQSDTDWIIGGLYWVVG